MKSVSSSMPTADWDGLEREVVAKLRVIKSIDAHCLAQGAAGRDLHNRMVIPCVTLLAEFCVSIELPAGFLETQSPTTPRTKSEKQT